MKDFDEGGIDVAIGDVEGVVMEWQPAVKIQNSGYHHWRLWQGDEEFEDGTVRRGWRAR
jgi:hypothetical protein